MLFGSFNPFLSQLPFSAIGYAGLWGGAGYQGRAVNKSFLLLFSAALALAGCAGRTTLVGGPGLEITANTELPAPEGVDAPYRLGPMDKIQVNVYGNDQLNVAAQVDSSGRVSIPLVGQIEAAGQTPAELEDVVRAGLRANFVRDPRVAINVVESLSRFVAVEGAVREPGLYPVATRLSLMRAIAVAKGLSEFAALEDVIIYRTVGEQRMAALYSLKGIREGRYPDPDVYAGDVVVVGDSPTRRLFRDITSAGGLLAAPLVAILR